MKKYVLIVFLLVVGAALVYGIAPLFNNKVVNDELPVGNTETMEPEENATTKREVAEEETTSRASFAIEHTTGHPAQGSVRIIEGDGKTYIRFEDFKTINGPNLRVYLAKDLDANEFIDLGEIRGTEGNINYEVPAGVDVSDYKYVLHWCVPFSVLFNYAEIGS